MKRTSKSYRKSLLGKLSDTFISILGEEKEEARVLKVAKLYELNMYPMSRINSLLIICIYLNFSLLINLQAFLSLFLKVNIKLNTRHYREYLIHVCDNTMYVSQITNMCE